MTREPGEPMQYQVYRFEHAGEPLPYFRNHTLGLRLDTHELRLVDTHDPAQTLWTASLPRTMIRQILQDRGNTNAAHFSCQTLGRLVILPVGHLVFGIDPVNRKILWEHSLAGPLPTSPPNQPAGPRWNQLIVDPRDGSILLLYPDGWMQCLGAPLVLGPSVLCLLTRDGLRGIDPLTGKVFWQRAEVAAHADLFGDEDVVCVVEKDTEGRARTSRVLRLTDGTAIHAPDFAALYNLRLNTSGRRLLVSEIKDTLTLRLYDVPAGKDVWTKSFPARTTVLHSEDPSLAGVVEPTGKVWVVDLLTGKEVLNTDRGYDPANRKTGMDPAHLEKLQGITLLADDGRIYLACNGETDPNIARFGGVQSNLTPGLGMRSVPINGRLYAYDRQAGTFQWQTAIFNQTIVLDRFREMPIILFTSHYTKWLDLPGRPHVNQAASVISLDKRTAKYIYINDNLNNMQPFHTLKFDARAGRIELISLTLTLVHHLAAVSAAP